jgi:hypothetical protein
LCEPGRSGAAALDTARELVELEDAALTIVGVAIRMPTSARCGNTALDYNGAVTAAVVEELDDARERLGPIGVGASYEMLIEGADPPLEQYAAAGAFDLVLLPARLWSLRADRHPAARRLARMTGAEVRVIARPHRRVLHA